MTCFEQNWYSVEMCKIMVRIVNFSVKASDVSHPHKMNHGVSEEHQVHTSASDTLIILLQVHLESFFKTFKRWDLKKEQNTIFKFDKTRKLLCEVWQEYTEEAVWITSQPWFLKLLHCFICKPEQCPERGLVNIDDQVWTTFFFNSFFSQWFKWPFGSLKRQFQL